MKATDSEKSVDWPAAILDSRCKWNLGESLCRRDLEGALSFYICYCDERTEESKHCQVRLKIETPCGLGMSRKEN